MARGQKHRGGVAEVAVAVEIVEDTLALRRRKRLGMLPNPLLLFCLKN